jgi:integrase
MATVKRRTWRTDDGALREAWRVRYVDQHGKARTRQFALKRDADAFRIQAEGQVAAGTHTPDSSSTTVAKAADLWVSTGENNGLERGTIKAYRELADLHIKPLLGKEKLSRLTQPKIETFKDALLKTRSPAMAAKAVRGLSMILADAMRRGLVAQNVAKGVTVRRSKRDKKRVVIPPREHLRALLDAADALGEKDPRLPVMTRLATFSGLRQSELRGIAWPSIDFRGGTVTVSQRADRWCDIGEPKSEAGTRTIPLGSDMVARLRAWKLRCPPSPKNLLFCTKAGKPLDQRAMAALFLAVQIKAGLAIDTGTVDANGATKWASRYGWHDLRHAAASAWIAQGVDLKRLQVWIGHANISLTLDCYGHLLTDAATDAALANGAEKALLA